MGVDERVAPNESSEPGARSSVPESAPHSALGTRHSAVVHVSPHPPIRHKLTFLRDRTTPPKRFREIVHEITQLLLYESTADVTTRPIPVETPMGLGEGHELDQRIGLIPILRAGLGMVE